MRARAFTFTLIALTLPLSAQIPETPPQTAALTITTRLVSIDAVVRDAGSSPVQGLDQSAFTLREDGHAVSIRYFNRDSDLPLTVGLLIDTSGSELEYFSNEILASSLFLEDVLRQPSAAVPGGPAVSAGLDPDSRVPNGRSLSGGVGDRAFILRFDTRIQLLQSLTSSLPALRNALRQIDYHPDPEIAKGGGGTLLFDALVQACTQIAAHETGRRALIVMTDGDDVGSHASLTDAIRAAQTAGISVYSIMYTREMQGYPNVPGLHPSGIGVMQQLAVATGGRQFIVGQNSLRYIYTSIEDDLRSQYRIGFTPTPSKPHKFHKLDLRTSDKTLTVQSRTGYSSPE